MYSKMLGERGTVREGLSTHATALEERGGEFDFFQSFYSLNFPTKNLALLPVGSLSWIRKRLK